MKNTHTKWGMEVNYPLGPFQPKPFNGSMKLFQVKFRLDIRKVSLQKGWSGWNKMSREVVESLSLEDLKDVQMWH